MDCDLTFLHSAILLVSGVAAGFVNTIAGGGGLLTLGALLLMGIPADVANGTNRVSVAAQSIAGVRGFHRRSALDTPAILPILAPTISGSLIGASVASFLPAFVLKSLLLSTMIGMALLLMLQPAIMTPPPETEPVRLRESPRGWVALFGAGLYGGFIQAGVGLLLLTALVGVLRYDLLRGNALKLVCTTIFGAVALSVFALRGQVLWLPGAIITVGTLIGVRLSINWAMKAKTKNLRIVLLIGVIATCVAAFFR